MTEVTDVMDCRCACVCDLLFEAREELSRNDAANGAAQNRPMPAGKTFGVRVCRACRACRDASDC